MVPLSGAVGRTRRSPGEGLWADEREFAAARAIVDSDPFVGGIQTAPDGRHFEYAEGGDAARRMRELADMFRDPATSTANVHFGPNTPPSDGPWTN